MASVTFGSTGEAEIGLKDLTRSREWYESTHHRIPKNLPQAPLRPSLRPRAPPASYSPFWEGREGRCLKIIVNATGAGPYPEYFPRGAVSWLPRDWKSALYNMFDGKLVFSPQGIFVPVPLKGKKREEESRRSRGLVFGPSDFTSDVDANAPEIPLGALDKAAQRSVWCALAPVIEAKRFVTGKPDAVRDQLVVDGNRAYVPAMVAGKRRLIRVGLPATMYKGKGGGTMWKQKHPHSQNTTSQHCQTTLPAQGQGLGGPKGGAARAGLTAPPTPSRGNDLWKSYTPKSLAAPATPEGRA